MGPLFNISTVSPDKTYFRQNAPTEMFTTALKIDQHQQEHFDYLIDPNSLILNIGWFKSPRIFSYWCSLGNVLLLCWLTRYLNIRTSLPRLEHAYDIFSLHFLTWPLKLEAVSCLDIAQNQCCSYTLQKLQAYLLLSTWWPRWMYWTGLWAISAGPWSTFGEGVIFPINLH